MGQWQVRGADRNSGHDVGQIYDAQTRDAAVTMAVQDGMLVETIEPLLVDDGHAGEPLDELDAALRREAALQPAGALLEYRNPSLQNRRTAVPPSYAGLLIAGRIIRVFAMIYYLIAAIALVAEVWSFAESSAAGTVTTPTMLLLAWPLGVGMIGALLHGIGSACFALRDIARNSWR